MSTESHEPSAADLRASIELFPHFVWTATPDGSIDSVNRWATEYTGQPSEAHYGWGWVDMVHPEDAERARSGWERAVRTEETPVEIEYRMRRHDGEFRWHIVRGLPVRGADGRVGSWIGTATDIHDHSLLGEDLRKAQRKSAELLILLDALQSTAPIGFGFVDREFRFVRINDALAAASGRPAEEHLGRTVVEVAPAVWPQMQSAYLRALETGEAVVNHEIVGEPHAAPGELRYWLSSFYPVRIDGEVTGVGIVVVDVTERRRAEEELKRSLEELRIANEERKRLLHALLDAHEEERQLIARDLHDDTVQVMTALALQLEMLATRTEDPEMLSGLSKATEIARSTIKSLRHLTFTLRPPELDRDGLDTAIEIQLEQIRQEAGIHVSLESNLTRKLAIETSTAAYRIVQEALVNIRKHANAQHIVVQLEETNGNLLGRITDDGRGFEPTAPDPGHIGLIGMRERAEAAGGTLAITSTPAKGTTVGFVLPAKPEEATSI